MQIGAYTMFDEPLTKEQIEFIGWFNDRLSGNGPKIKLIYKPFNRVPYEYEDKDLGMVQREAYDPNLPDYKYSLGWKVTIPEAPKDASEGMKRVFKKLGL